VSARRLSLPRAERSIPLLALLVAPPLAALAATSPRSAAYLVVAAMAVVIVLRSLLAGLALFIALTFPDQLPGALGIGATLAKPLGFVLVISWLLMIAADRERRIPFLPRDAPVLSYTLFALLFWCLASLLWASDRNLALHNFSRLLQLVSLVFVTYSAIRKPRDLLVLVWAFLIGALATSIYALTNGTLTAGRLTGGIFNPNGFAAKMMIALVLTIFLLVAARRTGLRLVLLVLLVPFSVAFVETQSRSGLIALAAAAAAMIVVGGPLRGRITAVILIAIAISLAYYVYAAPPQLRERVTSISGAGQASPLREDTWQIAVRMIKAHPAHGVGLGNFRTLESNYIIENLNVVQVRSLRHFELVVHNTYLEILAELGIVGLILFISVLASTFGRAAVTLERIGRGDELTGLVARALTAAVAGLLTFDIFGSGEYEKQLWLLLGMILAAALLDRKAAALERSPAHGRRRPLLAHSPSA
jgi:O-antigen ligase